MVENNANIVRVPRKEGSMFVESKGIICRGDQAKPGGFKNPVSGRIAAAGVGFFTTTFDLHAPAGNGISMYILFNNNRIREDTGQTSSSSHQAVC